MRLSFAIAFAAQCVLGTRYLDRNLVYRSPFVNHPQISHNTSAIQARHIQHARRQFVDSAPFADEHYPTFYGGDFSNSPFVWNGGINFTHSVASGDPFDTSVLLWTRATPISPASETPDQSVPVCVAFRISTSLDFSDGPVDSGEAFTSYDVDFTVKMEATGLQPDTRYFFQFSDCTNPRLVSPIGHTRTLPIPSMPARSVNGGKPLTLAVFSCSRYQTGYFNAYGVAAQNISADLFIHLGDYIYESLGNGTAIGRETLGRELATLHDYRQRLNQYRTDIGLAMAHQLAPWIAVWDDHEVADQAWKAGTADSNDTSLGCSFSPSGACFTDRKLAAVRAYHEWMPIRQVDPSNQLRIWRNFQIGKLIDLTMLDTRQYSRDLTDLYYNTDYVNSLANVQDRTLMGTDQEKWFLETLSESKRRGAVWRIVGQQIVFTQIDFGTSFNVDSWDGYRANRNRILNHLYGENIDNTIILAGDSHANWVSDLAHPNDTERCDPAFLRYADRASVLPRRCLRYNPITGHGAIGVEFAGTAVSSPTTFGENITQNAADARSRELVATNPDLQWSEGFYRGFFTLKVDSTRVTADFYAMKDINTPNLDAFLTATFVVQAGANKLQRPVAEGQVKAGALRPTGHRSTP